MADRTVPPASENGMPVSGLRLIHVIVLETLAVLLLGLLVFGMLWDMGFFRAGLIAGIAIWVLVSPAIEIATVLRMRSPSPSVSSTPKTPPDEQRTSSPHV
jgi:hypothetical protein